MEAPEGHIQKEDALRAFSIPQVLERVPIGRTALYEQIRMKRLKTIKIGSRTLVTANALKDWLEGAQRPLDS